MTREILYIIVSTIAIAAFVLAVVLAIIAKKKQLSEDTPIQNFIPLFIALALIAMPAAFVFLCLDVKESRQFTYDSAHPAYTYEIRGNCIQVNVSSAEEKIEHKVYNYDYVTDRMSGSTETVEEFCKLLESKGYTKLIPDDKSDTKQDQFMRE